MPSLVDLETLTYIGDTLSRPECVLATSSGSTFACDWRGGIVQIGPDGRQKFLGYPMEPGQSLLLPNGIALLRDGSFLAANLSDQGGCGELPRTVEQNLTSWRSMASHCCPLTSSPWIVGGAPGSR